MNLDIAIYLFCAYSLIMKRKQEIINALESAAVDGGFKLYVDRNRQIVAVDLFDETNDFGLCFED